MWTSEPRKGIERKILTSILTVGIAPMAVALIIGFISAREGQSTAIRQYLSSAAYNKAEGLRLASNARLRTVRKLALHPLIIDALLPDGNGLPKILTSPQPLQAVNDLFQLDAHSLVEESPSVFSLYDAQGHLLSTTSAGQVDEAPQLEVRPNLNKASFAEIAFQAERNQYTVKAIAPVYQPGSDTCIGYVTEVMGINTLLSYGLGRVQQTERPGSDHYQVVYLGQASMVVSYLQDPSNAASARLETQKADPQLTQAIEGAPGPGAKTLRISHYQGMLAPTDVFLAYHRLFDDVEFYTVVYRPISTAFQNINRGALLAFFGSAIFIAVMCLNAYRNVHNNIVRPVSLLNDGAQIIGQGDLELKLKIGTGDEIEELANSFNKMALALKGNIRQLEESEEKYRSLITSMRDGIFQTDPNAQIVFLNPAGVEILGYLRVQEATAQNLRELFLEELDFARLVHELDTRGFIERSRVWMKRRDGRAICVELSGNRVLDDYGATVGTEGIFRDVTKSVRLEQEARDRSERISAINQIANVINSSLEAGRLYESLVGELKKLVGFEYAALALFHDKERAFDYWQLWPQREEPPGQTLPLEDASCEAWVARQRECLIVEDLTDPGTAYSHRFPEGARSCLCVPLYASGRIIGTLNLGANRSAAFSRHDVEVLEQMAPHIAVAIGNAQLLQNLQASLEEVTRAREKLHDANEELKTLDEMKTNLLSNVSHELRTPLVAVMGYTDMIYNGKGGPISETQREYLAISLRNIERLVTLIENLLDFSRLHRGTETLVFDTLDLVDCTRSSIQIMQPLADSREIELELLSDDDKILVEGDKGKLGQVFNNLLSNAVKFNHNGGQVIVELRRGKESVEVSVRDTGIGIPEEALDKVFTRFYQYDSSSTRKYGGTGIGLSIAQDIVSLHGSRITATSEVGKGTTFRFALPLTGAHLAKSGGEAPGELPSKQTHLLIEVLTPDRALSTQVRTLLDSEGMDVIHAINVTNAIMLAQKHRPDCIVIDADSQGQGQGQLLLDELLADATVGVLPIILLTNDDDLYTRYNTLVAARIKRGFRKSSLLSGIHYALNQGVVHGEPFGDKILCVDDDPEIRTFIVRCLASEGYVVHCCNSGEEALQEVVSREYGVVLLDIAMPGMDGWETCRRIKGDSALVGISVYMVTAKPIDSKSLVVQDACADGFLFKPFKAEELVELIQGLDTVRSTRKV